MYFMNKITNVDTRPIVATLYDIAIPQYPYKVSELPQVIAEIGGARDIFVDVCVTVEDHVYHQRNLFEKALEEQGLSYNEKYRRLNDIMEGFISSCGGTGDFQHDYEKYRATECLHDVGLKSLVSEHILSSMWSLFIVDGVRKRLYYINDGGDENDRGYTSKEYQGVIDITDSIKAEAQAQGVLLPPFDNLDELQDCLDLLLWGHCSGSVVVKYVANSK